ncbi:MAG: phospholipase D-like domain-containing protein [Alicyclobacillaceae bacterium]|nr:phospholipase D-like domain-containing protein [Alicyclobacillaceae bacterium]
MNRTHTPLRARTLLRILAACWTVAVLLGACASPVRTGADSGLRLVWGERVRDQSLRWIDRAATLLWIEMYEWGDEALLEAAARAADRGVDVRVILDATEEHSRRAFDFLRREGVQVRQAAVPGGIDHVKLLLTDEGCLVGSMNWGPGSWANHDLVLRVPADHPLGRECRAHFEKDWEHGVAHRREAGQWVYSGEAVRDVLTGAVERAQRSIYAEIFDLNDETVLRSLARAAGRGVEVHVLLDPRQPDRWFAQDFLAASGADVRLYRSRGERLHAKVLVADEETVVMGSANWTNRAFEVNHELNVAFRSRRLAAEILEDWRSQAARIR